MTNIFLKRYLLLSGWAAIIATGAKFGVSLFQRLQRMSELDIDGELRAQTFALHTFGYGIELPLMLAIACLCLVASRALTFKQQTIQSVFE